MNVFQLNNPNELLESEELEYWELNDFDDVLQDFKISELEIEPIANNKEGEYAVFH